MEASEGDKRQKVKGKRQKEGESPRCPDPFAFYLLPFSFAYRFRLSRRALRFLLPTLRRRRGLAMQFSFRD